MTRFAGWGALLLAAAITSGGGGGLFGGVDAAVMRRDAAFMEVRTKMTKDMSGRGGDPKEKYFHESIFHPHYDGRFAEKELPYIEKKRALSNLIQTYLATFTDIGVETWIMHGSLLGWWWNRKILPWDSDLDVQVTEESMTFLASYYNMTVFHYRTPRIPEGRDYMLEINPHYTNREQTDRLNVIDARWTDTDSGLFIDITTVRRNRTHPGGAGILSCKDGHEYRESLIFPLRDTSFEGHPVKVPFAYAELLTAEYGQSSLTQTDFAEHIFDEVKLEWIPKPPVTASALQIQAERLLAAQQQEAARLGLAAPPQKAPAAAPVPVAAAPQKAPAAAPAPVAAPQKAPASAPVPVAAAPQKAPAAVPVPVAAAPQKAPAVAPVPVAAPPQKAPAAAPVPASVPGPAVIPARVARVGVPVA